MTKMTHQSQSDMPGGSGFSVRTVYSCDICGVEVDHEEKIIKHLAEHNQDTKSAGHGGHLGPAMPQQQNNVTLSSSAPVSLRQKSKNVLEKQSSSQVAKPLVCGECGCIYKYLRCFNRHMERVHKSIVQCSSDVPVRERQQRGAVDTALHLTADNVGLSDCEQEPPASRDCHADNALSNADHTELREMVVFTAVSDNKHSGKDIKPQSQISPYCCQACPKQFQSHHSLSIHTADKHTGWNLVCKWCGHLFQDTDTLSSHITSDHNEMIEDCDLSSVDPVLNPPYCIVCSSRYRSEKELDKHMEFHDQHMSTFACSMCSGIYSSRSGLNCHIQRAHSSDRPYPCESCGARFATAEGRSEHVKEHADELCTVCGIRVRQSVSSAKDDGAAMCSVCYLEELASKNGVRIIEEPPSQAQPVTNSVKGPLLLNFSCKKCGIRFAWRSNLLRHEKKCTSDNRRQVSTDAGSKHFQCAYCSRVFNNASGLWKHIHRHVSQSASQLTAFSCRLCGQSFSLKRGLLRHLRTVHPPSSTHHIPVVSSSLNAVDRDMLAANVTSNPETTGDTLHVCDACGHQFESFEMLSAHCRDHHSDIPQFSENESNLSKNKALRPCPECNAVFFWGSNLRRHVQEEHRGEKTAPSRSDEWRLQCTRCGRRFARLSYLRTHLQAHVKAEQGGKRLESMLCSECGKMVSSRRQLRFHMQRHSGVRPYKCNQCNKSFYVRAYLNSHVSVVHCGNRFVCDKCGHKANSKSAMRIHNRSVHPTPGNEPQYPCPQCSRRFWAEATRLRHMEAHDPTRSAQRKAMCSICSMLFRHVFNLAHHIKTAHTDIDSLTPFACATCNQQFDSGQAFKTHYRSKHRKR